MEAVSLRRELARGEPLPAVDPSPAEARSDPRARRLAQAQRPRRQQEQAIRQRAVQYRQDSGQRGWPASAAARELGVAPRTLRHWLARAGQALALRGRHPQTCSPLARHEVLRFLREVSGPAVGLAALQALFHGLSRCLLQDLLRRYRRVWRRRYRQHGFRLDWHAPGRVWAIDFSEALYPIDGVYPYLLAVRDLASHQQLAWHPLQTPSAPEGLAVLVELFQRSGPPLVLKSDNGSAFVAELFQQALAVSRVLPLYSPPQHPQYNGALERSNGTLKTYTHQHAVHEGHAFRWTSEDVEHARQLANTLSRPWGSHGATPDEAWQARTPLPTEERCQFLQVVEQQRARARRDLGLEEHAVLSHFDQARLDRLALSRALVQLGYLTMRRADRPPKKPRRLSRQKLARRAQQHLDKVLSTPDYALASADWPLPSSDTTDASALRVDLAIPANQGLALASRCWTTSGEDSPLATQASALFASAPHATMPISQDAAVLSPEIAPASPPADVQRANTSWFRRSITLLLSLAKAAVIM